MPVFLSAYSQLFVVFKTRAKHLLEEVLYTFSIGP